jgi:hypothetical protein
MVCWNSPPIPTPAILEVLLDIKVGFFSLACARINSMLASCIPFPLQNDAKVGSETHNSTISLLHTHDTGLELEVIFDLAMVKM